MPCRATVSWGQGGTACHLGGRSKGMNVSPSLCYTHPCSEYIRGPSGWGGRPFTADKCGHMLLRALCSLGPRQQGSPLPQRMQRKTGPWEGSRSLGALPCPQILHQEAGTATSLPTPALLLTLVSATESHATLSESLKWPGKTICAHGPRHEGPAHGMHLQPAPALPCSPPAASRPNLTPASPPGL